MEIRNLETAINILASYHPGNSDYWNVSAEHDELFLPGLAPEKMKDKHVAALEELGWSWVPEFDSWQHYL